MKRMIPAASVLLLLLAFVQIFALNTYCKNEIIRVGLTRLSGVSSVGIGSQSVMAGCSTGESFDEIQYLDISGGGTLSRSYSYYISVGEGFINYADAKAEAATLTGYNAIPAYKGSGMWAVYIGPYDSAERAAAASENYPGEAVVCAPSEKTMYLAGAADRMIYDFAGGNFALAGDSFIGVGGTNYRGYVEFCQTDGGFSAVNVLPLETYLCGVVPSEMPSGWGAEALKAQAVAARTYTVNKLNAGGETALYDICDTPHCQMYSGTADETPASDEAVNATRGQVLTYNGSLINAVYCACCGGVTDDDINVWGSSTPYLKSVKEIEGGEVYTWSRDYTFSELSALLASKGINIGKLVYVSVDRSDNGRVYSMTFTGEGGSHTIEKEEVRTFFSAAQGGSLQSRVFDISFEYGSEFVLHIDGKGWGHGLGLSQYGAKSMAAAGYTYDEILKHYYTGVELVND